MLKNLINVGLLTVNPPQIHSTNWGPINGTEEKKLVITVAAQRLIWPHTKIYPEKAANITNKKIAHPENQSFILVKLLKYIAFAKCIYKKKNINETTFTCKLRTNHPKLISLIISYSIDNQACAVSLL